jgi:hypothetical protein
MFSAVVITVGFGPRLLTSASGRPLENVGKVSASASVCLQFNKVGELLSAGRTKEAKQLLDQIGGETLVVEGATGGEGALEDFSPVTLLVNVTRQMLAQARRDAETGNAREALGWVGRCRELSAQVLATSNPNLDSLHTARTIDALVGREEVAVRKALGDHAGARAAAEREGRVAQFYQTAIRNRVEALNVNGSTAPSQEVRALMELYQTQRLRLAARTGADAGA